MQSPRARAKQTRAAALLACAFASFLAFAPALDAAAGRVVVSYWEKWTGFELEAMRDIVTDFNNSQQRIEVRLLPVVNIDIKLLLATSGGNPPDIAGLWSFLVPDFAEKGALTPLGGAIAKSNIRSFDYIPAYWELCQHRGFTWALPIAPACTALFYNRALFRAAGLNPNHPPRTIGELEEMNKKLTFVEFMRGGQRTAVAYAGLPGAIGASGDFKVLRIGHMPQEPDSMIELWGFWFGGRFDDGARRITADDPGNLAALQWMREVSLTYGGKNLAQLRSGFGNRASAQNAFLSGSVAMVMDGVWWPNFINNYAPALDWGVAAFPSADALAGSPPVTIIESDVVVIPRGAAHPREAFEFMRYLQRQDVAEKLARAQRKFTALKEVSDGFANGHPNREIAFFIRLSRSPGARAVPRLPFWLEYKAEMRTAVEDVIALRQLPAPALENVQRRMQKRMDRWTRRWDAVGAARIKEWRAYENKW